MFGRKKKLQKLLMGMILQEYARQKREKVMAKEMTINEAMVMMKALRGRLGELSSLRSKCSLRETYYGEKDKVIEPTYDIKVVDKKCVEIENALLFIETKIKQSNAITKIEVDADVKKLMQPLS